MFNEIELTEILKTHYGLSPTHTAPFYLGSSEFNNYVKQIKDKLVLAGRIFLGHQIQPFAQRYVIFSMRGTIQHVVDLQDVEKSDQQPYVIFDRVYLSDTVGNEFRPLFEVYLEAGQFVTPYMKLATNNQMPFMIQVGVGGVVYNLTQHSNNIQTAGYTNFQLDNVTSGRPVTNVWLSGNLGGKWVGGNQGIVSLSGISTQIPDAPLHFEQLSCQFPSISNESTVNITGYKPLSNRPTILTTIPPGTLFNNELIWYADLDANGNELLLQIQNGNYELHARYGFPWNSTTINVSVVNGMLSVPRYYNGQNLSHVGVKESATQQSTNPVNLVVENGTSAIARITVNSVQHKSISANDEPWTFNGVIPPLSIQHAFQNADGIKGNDLAAVNADCYGANNAFIEALQLAGSGTFTAPAGTTRIVFY
jgi:hypothetical protein